MIGLSVICGILLILPFGLAFIHSCVNKRLMPPLLYYRYFMTFNMILASLFVTGRMFFDGPHAAAINGWAYSPVYNLYGVAIFSMAILALLTVYSRRIIMLAPAICWSAFLILSTVCHLYQLNHNHVYAVQAIYVHIIYNILVSLIMLRMVHRINTMFRRKIDVLQSVRAAVK